jgi:hypothetical protein
MVVESLAIVSLREAMRVRGGNEDKMRAIFAGQVEGGLQPLTAREPRHRGRRCRPRVDASVKVGTTVLAGGKATE